MFNLKWSASEKKHARRAYEAAVDSALDKIMAEFKGKAAAVTTPGQMWAVEDYLREQRRSFDRMFDYRYSQLPFVFAQLVHEGYLDEAQLLGLSAEKLGVIRDIQARMKRLTALN